MAGPTERRAVGERRPGTGRRAARTARPAKTAGVVPPAMAHAHLHHREQEVNERRARFAAARAVWRFRSFLDTTKNGLKNASIDFAVRKKSCNRLRAPRDWVVRGERRIRSTQRPQRLKDTDPRWFASIIFICLQIPLRSSRTNKKSKRQVVRRRAMTDDAHACSPSGARGWCAREEPTAPRGARSRGEHAAEARLTRLLASLTVVNNNASRLASASARVACHWAFAEGVARDAAFTAERRRSSRRPRRPARGLRQSARRGRRGAARRAETVRVSGRRRRVRRRSVAPPNGARAYIT